MNPKDQNNRINRVEAKIYLPIMAAAWLVLSILLGWLLCFIAQPFDLVTLLYSNYQEHIENYNLFCLIMIAALLLMPFALLFTLRNGFSVVLLRSGGGLIFFIIAAVGMLIGLGAISIDGKNKFSQLARGVVNYLDWLGAVAISFAGLFLFVSCIVVLLKNGRNH